MESNYDKLIKYFTEELKLQSIQIPIPIPIKPKINIKNIIKECSKIHFNLWDHDSCEFVFSYIDIWDCSAIDCSQVIEKTINEEIPIVLEKIIEYIEIKKININFDSLECSNFITRHCIINVLEKTPDNEIPNIINLIINTLDINNSMTMLYQFSNTYCIFDLILKYNICIDFYINKYGEDNFIDLFLNKSNLKGPKPICRFFSNIDNLELSQYKKNIYEKITKYLKLNKSLLLCSDKSILKNLLSLTYKITTNYIPIEIQNELLTQNDFNIIVNRFTSPYYYEHLSYFLVNNINVSDKLLRELSLVKINNDSKIEYEKCNIFDNNILIKIVFDPYCSIVLSKNTEYKNYIPIRDIIATYLINNDNNFDIFNDDNVIKTIEIDKNKIDIDIIEMWKSLQIMYKYLNYMNDKYLKITKFKERINKFCDILYDLAMNNSEHELYIDFCCLLCTIINDSNIEYIIKILLNNTFINKLIEYKKSDIKNKFIIEYIKNNNLSNDKLLFVLHLMSIINNDYDKIENKYKNKYMFETIIMLRTNNYDNINKKNLKYIQYLDFEYIINKLDINIILKLIKYINNENKTKINNNPEIIMIKSGILQEKLIDKLINKNIIDINTISQYIDNNSFNNNILLSIIKYTKKNNIIINYQKSFNNYILNKTLDDFTNDEELLLWFIDNIEQLELHKYIVSLINNSELGNKILIQYFNSLVKLNKTNILYFKIITEYININYIATHVNELFTSVELSSKINEINSDIFEEFIFAIIGYINIYSKKELLEIIIKMCNNKKYCDKICNNALSYIDSIPNIIVDIITNEYWNTNIYNNKIFNYTNIKKYIDTIEYDYQIKFLRMYFEKNKPPSSYDSLKKYLINAPFMKIITEDTYNIIKSFDTKENIHINLFIKEQTSWILNNDNIIALYNLLDKHFFCKIANNNMDVICNNSTINFDSVILFANITKLTFDLTHIEILNIDFENETTFVKCYNEGLIKCNNIENIINKKPHLLLSIKLNDIIFNIVVKKYISDISFLSKFVIANLDNKLLCKLLDIIINYYYESEPYELIKILDLDCCTIYKYISNESCDKIKSLVQYDYNFIEFIKNCGTSCEEICKLKSIDGNLIVCNAMCINIMKYGEYVKYIDFDDLFIKDKLGKYVIENMWNSDEIKKLFTKRNDYEKIKSKIKKKNITFYNNITFCKNIENMKLNIKNTINVFMMKCVNEIDSSWLDNFSGDDMIKLLLTKDSDNNYGLFYVIRYYPYWFKDNISDYWNNISYNIISNKFGETLPMYCLRYSPKCYETLIENNIITKKDCYISTICGSILTYSIKYYIEYFQSIICSDFFTPYTLNTYDCVNIIDFYTQDKLEFKTIVNIINILIVYRRDDEFTTLMQKYKNIVKKYIEEVFFINCDKYNSLKLSLLYCPKIARIIINSHIISNKYISETFSYFTDYEQFRLIGTIQPESWVYIIQSINPEIVAFKKNEVNINNLFGVRLNGNFIIESFKDNAFIKTICHTQIYDYSDNNKCKLCLNCKENISYYCGHRLCVRCHVMRLWGNIPKCPYCSCEINNDKQVIYIG
jgi:hypothetical protein